MFSINSTEVYELRKILSRVLEHRDFYSIMLSGSNIHRLENILEAFDDFINDQESRAYDAQMSDTNIILGME